MIDAEYQVIAVRRDRLGARLCAIGNGLRLAQSIGADFKFVWPKNAVWSKQIDAAEEILSEDFIKSYECNDKRILPDLENHIDSKKSITVLEKNKLILISTATELLDLSKFGIHERITFSDAFNLFITFSPTIQNVLNQFEEYFGNDDIALHVRRGDILTKADGYLKTNGLHMAKRYAPMEFFSEYLSKLPIEHNAWVFSEARSCFSELEQLIGTHKIKFVDLSSYKLTTLQEACSELLLLSKFGEIVGTFSAFKNTAALIGGGNSTDLSDFFSVRERIRLLNKALKRIDSLSNERRIATAGIAQASFELSRALEREGQLDEAIGLAKEAINLESGQQALHHHLGNLLLRQGDCAGAETHLRKAVGITGPNAGIDLSLSRVLGRQQRFEEAISVARQAIQIKPDWQAPHHHLANLLIDQGDCTDAEAHLRKALELGAPKASIYLSLSRALEHQERIEGAIEAIREAIQLEPNRANLLHRLANLMIRQGNFAAAEAYLREALELGAPTASIYLSLSRAIDRQGRIEGAIDATRQAIQLEPNRQGLHHHLAELLARHGEPLRKT